MKNYINNNIKKSRSKSKGKSIINSDEEIEEEKEQEENSISNINKINSSNRFSLNNKKKETKKFNDQLEIQLHKIKIKNFKSFKDENEIGIFKNLSAVIGPNGSGKSNILDAICFALGVKSISLRCKNIKELIHKSNSDNLTNENINDYINDNNTNDNLVRECFVEIFFKIEKDIYLDLQEKIKMQKSQKNKNKDKDNKEKNKKDNKDSDFHIMCFKRTITQKGTSEFFIDEIKTNYDDYMKILEDLKIPSNIRYFILIQGAIDTLLTKKNDLCETIEFLSGSIKYKEKYDYLKKEIEELNQEITKISNEKDIVRIDKSKLKLQIENEEKFTMLKDDLNFILQKIFLLRLAYEDLNIYNNNNLLEENKKSEEICNKEKSEKIKNLQKINEELYKLEKLNKIDDKEADILKQNLDEINSKYISCSENIKIYDAQILGKISMVNQKKIDIEKNEGKLNLLQKEKKDLDQDILNLTIKMNHEDPLGKLPKDLIKVYQDLSNEFDLNVFTLKQKISEASKELVENKEKLDLIFKQKENLFIEINNLKEDISKNKKKEIDEFKKNSEFLIQKESLIKDIDTLKKEVFKSKLEFDEKKLELEEVQKRLNSTEENTIENIKRNKVLEITRNNPKIYGYLYELISPIKKQMELPVKVSLLKYLNYLVVEDNQTAKECSNDLKIKNLSVDVIVLENVPKFNFNENLRKNIGNIGILVMDLIDCKRKELREAVQFFIKDIVLCYEANKENINILREKGFKNIISLEGTLFKKSSIVTGNYKNLEQYNFNYSSNLTSEIKSLKKKEIDLEKNIMELDLKIRKANDIEDMENKLANNEKLRKNFMEKMENIRNNILNDEALLIEKDKKYKNEFNAEEDFLNNKIFSLEKSLKNLEEKNEEIRLEIFEDFLIKNNLNPSTLNELKNFSIEEIKKISSELKNKQEKLNKIEKEISAFSNQIILLEYLEKSLSNDKQKKIEFEEDLKILKIKKGKISEENEAYLKDKNNDYDKIKTLKGEISQKNSELDNLDKRKNALLKNKLEFEHIIKKSIDNKNNIFQESRISLENFLAEIGVNLDSIYIAFNLKLEEFLLYEKEIYEKNNLIIDYKLIEKKDKFMIEENGNLNENNFDIDYANQKLEKLKEKFKSKFKEMNQYVKLINLIDEDNEKDLSEILDKKKENLKELLKQSVEDLDELKEKFNEVKENRIKLFNELFDELSNKVDSVYKEITKPNNSNNPGGSVYLHKSNNEEPYLGYINYLPTPPGKRSVLDIDLLSGGEKTLAILCLLISLQSISKTPLIILDEIDCYLDPLHENMLEKLINKKNKEFQIVIVTHKSNIFRNAHSLIGTFHSKSKNSSISMSLDMQKFENKKV
jgi:structural maintenance of chromosome 1